MARTKWKYISRDVKKATMDKHLERLDFDKVTSLPARFDSRTVVYYKDKLPILKVVHKLGTDTYNLYKPD